MNIKKFTCKNEGCNKFAQIDLDGGLPGNFSMLKVRSSEIHKYLKNELFIEITRANKSGLLTEEYAKSRIVDLNSDGDEFILFNIEDLTEDVFDSDLNTVGVESPIDITNNEIEIDKNNRIILNTQFFKKRVKEIIVYLECEDGHWNKYKVKK